MLGVYRVCVHVVCIQMAKCDVCMHSAVCLLVSQSIGVFVDAVPIKR